MTLSANLTTLEKIVNVIGTTARAAATVGADILPVVQTIATVLPPAEPVAIALATALPVVQQIATYAPQVSNAIAQGAPVLEALQGVGSAITQPLTETIASAAQKLGIDITAQDISLAALNAALEGVFHANEFLPQDPRFSRDDPSAY